MKKTVLFFFLAMILLFSAGCSCGNDKINLFRSQSTPEPTPVVTAEPTPMPTPKPSPTPVYTYSDWSGWSATPAAASDSLEVETREIRGYNLVLYVTQCEDYPYSRQFRDSSINGKFDDNSVRPGYGEKKFTRFATEEELSTAKQYGKYGIVKGDYAGICRSTGTGYLIPGDPKLWYIESPVVKTEYRCREVSVSYVD